MKEGDVVLAPLPQADGRKKTRPALVLRVMQPFGALLVCGISTQLHYQVEGFDEIIAPGDADYEKSGLLAPSLIRLGFLAALPRTRILGGIGGVSPERHRRLVKSLSDYLVTKVEP